MVVGALNSTASRYCLSLIHIYQQKGQESRENGTPVCAGKTQSVQRDGQKCRGGPHQAKGAGTVSYTHLDVYKRQTYGSKIKVFGTEIPHSVRAKEISAEGKSIFAHDHCSRDVQAKGRSAAPE